MSPPMPRRNSHSGLWENQIPNPKSGIFAQPPHAGRATKTGQSLQPLRKMEVMRQRVALSARNWGAINHIQKT